jgi:hypothetical protein
MCPALILSQWTRAPHQANSARVTTWNYSVGHRVFRNPKSYRGASLIGKQILVGAESGWATVRLDHSQGVRHEAFGIRHRPARRGGHRVIIRARGLCPGPARRWVLPDLVG